jgi:hypothetical protein
MGWAGYEYDPEKHCGAERAAGPCRRPKGWRTDHAGIGRCFRHGGSSPSHRKAAEREMLVNACAVLGVPVEVDPERALIDAIWEARGNVEFYRAMIQELPQHPTPDDYVPAEEIEGADEDTKGYWVRGETGVYGRTYHVSGVPTGEAKPHILISLYNDERDRLVDYVKVALQLKVEERRLRIAERDAAAIAQAQIQTLIALGLGNMLEEFRKGFHERLNLQLATSEPPALSA